jgi:hypothetical protein
MALTVRRQFLPEDVALGQNLDPVTGALCQRQSVVDVGTNKIYVFKDMKVTF